MTGCCAFFYDVNHCVESYFKHIYAAYIVWDRAFKKYYLRSVQRALRTDADPVALAVLYHDLGKLTKEYKEGNRRVFRHELVGAYLAYRLINDNRSQLNLYVAHAVMLHHESGIIGIYAGERGEEFITLSTLRDVIESADLSVYCDLTLDPWYKKAKAVYGNEIDKIASALSNMNKEDFYEAIKEIVVRATVGRVADLLTLRTRTATLLFPLTLVDSIAASLTRPKELVEGDSGTWLTKRAFGLDEQGLKLPKAEIPTQDEIMKALRSEGILT
ncbi:CRISPR-associated endonuclease Cas3'' [Infirmifilum sp.]|uniref:CRISPR-associated endonuclease Cas3'' n=1 Tax=Infirmifilum sp. TaxID=2856575 RepID=UPI003D102E72